MTPREIIAQQEEIITQQEEVINSAQRTIESAKRRIEREKAEIELRKLNKKSRTATLTEFISDKISLYMDLLYFKYINDVGDSPDEDSSLNTQRYYVFYSNLFEKYDWFFTDDNTQVIPTVYFNSAEVAQRCVDWLNSKEEGKVVHETEI